MESLGCLRLSLLSDCKNEIERWRLCRFGDFAHLHRPCCALQISRDTSLTEEEFHQSVERKVAGSWRSKAIQMAEGEHAPFDDMAEEYDDVGFSGEAGEVVHSAQERFSLGSAGDQETLESECESEENEVTNASDTTAAEARRGKDIQGIPWSVLQFTREKYREQRLQQYKNYENLDHPNEQLASECKSSKKGEKFYRFRYNTRSVKSTYVHFQLRNLVWATSKHDIYLMHSYSVMHWSSITQKSSEVLNASGPITSVTEAQRNPCVYNQQNLGPIQISTMCVKRNLLAAGGFQGEMVCKNLNRPHVSYCAKITHDENAITNAIDIYDSTSGGLLLMSSNNDSVVRVFDCERFSVLSKFEYRWPVNHTSVSPDGRLVVVVGDNADGLLADARSGKVIETLKGHLDYSFASAWHPVGCVFATGNQDTTCRLWDARRLNTPIAVLKGRIGAIRSIRFSSDGQFMAMAEPADFVHIFNANHDFSRCQEIDIFGEVAGISYSPDTEALFIGVADRTYGSLLEFNRCRANMYLDSYV